MIRTLIALFFLFSLVTDSFAQRKIGDYTYIVVPYQYTFLKGKDTHRLNTLTRYELRNYGYEAVFQEELPEDLKRCDVLWLEAESKTGFPYTKTTVHLKDCNGFTVYSTKEGKSKEKEYKVAYQESMRRALESFELTALAAAEAATPSEGTERSRKTTAAVVATEEAANAAAEEVSAKEVVMSDQETYSYQDFQLIARGDQFEIRRAGEKIGTMVPTSQKNTYLVNTNGFSGIARKTKNGFEIERQVEGQSDLMVMKFVKDE
ncbi:hypothetical protein [Aureitalea marina]|uniref:DUF4468 domain-containing protein n=1 Tax=Aureitalea marina TaxID=930804 RepID=A0A2S7KQQ5_9FLAO|nr:hypothetical protein [Aureitalea marina]PQB04955.1 hypothetical protein BST85_08665 [Aureitalea marina]